MTPRLRQLIESGTIEPEAFDRFVADHDFPLVEGTTTTFVYRGEADAVLLRHWIYGLPSAQPFERIPGTDLWHLVLELPARSRVEYKIEIVTGNEHRLIRDPMNPHLAHDPYGANSVCQGSGYRTPEWIEPDEEARPGEMVTIQVDSEALGETREIDVYVPPRLSDLRRSKLLIVHDGRDYVRYAGLRAVLDNLIYRLEVAPIVVALTQSPRRLVEYAGDERHARFVAEEVVSTLEERFPLRTESSARGLMGASFGAVAALSTAWRYPGHFGRLLLQSGSFAFTDIGDHERGPAFDPVVQFMNRFRDEPGRPSDRLFVSCGTYESLIYENRSLVPLLQATGMDVRYVEARDGHNWENWRDRLREGLAWLFPGPLWMVYE